MKSIRTRAFGNLMAPLALIAAAVVSQPAHALDAVSFIPGTYYLAESNLGPAVDTLVVTVSGGTADFTLSGVDNATFAVPDGARPMEVPTINTISSTARRSPRVGTSRRILT